MWVSSYLHVYPSNEEGVGGQFSLWQNVTIGQLVGRGNLVAAPGLVDILRVLQKMTVLIRRKYQNLHKHTAHSSSRTLPCKYLRQMTDLAQFSLPRDKCLSS